MCSMDVQSNATNFALQCGVFNVITTEQGQKLIINAMINGILGGNVVQALSVIAGGSGMDYPNINKHIMVQIIRLLCDIHLGDSQAINAYLVRTNQLEKRQLEDERQRAARQKNGQQGGQGSAVATTPPTAAPKKKEKNCKDFGSQISGIGYGTTPCLVQNIDAEVQVEGKDVIKREETCIFYKRAACSFGRSGTNCRFQHPTPCPFFEIYGPGRFGCRKGAKCKLLHRTVCKNFMNGTCTQGKGCSYFHPMGLRGEREVKRTKQKPNEAHHDATSTILTLLLNGLLGGDSVKASANKICDGWTRPSPKIKKKT